MDRSRIAEGSIISGVYEGLRHTGISFIEISDHRVPRDSIGFGRHLSFYEYKGT